MEDPDPQLRQSLKEMIFEGDIFSWNRLEDLMKSAGSQSELNIESLIDNILDFLYSKNGGILRKEIVTSLVSKLDTLAWNTIRRLSKKMHLKETRKVSESSYEKKTDRVIAVRRILYIINDMPGFKLSMIIKRLPRMILEPEGIKMGGEIAKNLTEKSMIRIIKRFAGA